MNTTGKNATQKFVPIKDIRDQVVILDDNSLRAVIMTNSVNFSLKSKEEREAALYQFQNFFNTLDFPLQIYVQSRRLDIEPYLDKLREQQENQDNELLKIQTKEYIEFIKEFTDNVNIMTKSFFLIIPYYTAFQGGGSSGFLSGLLPGSGQQQDQQEKEDRSFEQRKMQVEQRVGVVEQSLSRTGLRTKRLGDKELEELYHSFYNPGEYEHINLESS